MLTLARALAIVPVVVASRPADLARPGASGSVSAGDFDCVLVLTLDGSVGDRWDHTLSEEAPKIPTVSKVARGEEFLVHVFFSNYAAGKEDEVKLTYDLHISKPDGSTYHEQLGIDAHHGRVAPGAGLLLSRETIHVSFDPPDPLGGYAVRVVAHDEVKGTTASANAKIELVETLEAAPFADFDALEEWVSSYFESPSPERAVLALTSFARLAPDEVKTSEAKVEGATASRQFFHEVFEANPWLYPSLVDAYATCDAESRSVVLETLSRSTVDLKAFVAGLGEEDARAWKRLRARTFRDPISDPIRDPADLDVLWGRFLAKGTFAPIYRICEALAPEATDAVPDEKFAGEKGEPPVSLRVLISRLAEWSLSSNAEEHEVVKSYCHWIQEQKNVPEALRTAIGKALGS